MDLREIGLGGVDWIRLAQDRDRWRAVVIAVMNPLATTTENRSLHNATVSCLWPPRSHTHNGLPPIVFWTDRDPPSVCSRQKRLSVTQTLITLRQLPSKDFLMCH
jgi:hypothetical protein